MSGHQSISHFLSYVQQDAPGRSRLKLKLNRKLKDDTQSLIFSQRGFVERLAGMIPPAWLNQPDFTEFCSELRVARVHRRSSKDERCFAEAEKIKLLFASFLFATSYCGPLFELKQRKAPMCKAGIQGALLSLACDEAGAKDKPKIIDDKKFMEV